VRQAQFSERVFGEPRDGIVFVRRGVGRRPRPRFDQPNLHVERVGTKPLAWADPSAPRYRCPNAADPAADPGHPDGPRTSWITDPDGYRIELVQWPAGHADGITSADFPEPTDPARLPAAP
jgi:hypothetical protein